MAPVLHSISGCIMKNQKHIFLSIIALCFCMSAPLQAKSKALNITNFAQKSEINRTHIELLYQNVFRPYHPSTLSTNLRLHNNLELKNLSMSSGLQAEHSDTEKGKETMNNIIDVVRDYFKDNLKMALLPSTQAANKTPKAPPTLTVESDDRASNHLSPKLNVGTSYVKPILSIENMMGSQIETNLSYQTEEKTMGANFEKALNQDFVFKLENIYSFENAKDHRFLMEIKYNFF